MYGGATAVLVKPGTRVLVSLIFIAAALLGSAASPAAAASPSVIGKLTGKLPPRARAVTELRAFDIAGASLVRAIRVGANGRFRLALAPGAYVLVTNVIPKHGGRRSVVQRVTPLTLAAGQHRSAVKIAKPNAKSSAAPRARAAYAKESGAIKPGTIAFTIDTFTGATGDLAGMNRGIPAMLQTDVMGAPCRFAVVAGGSDLGLIGSELELSKSKFVDPSTRLTRNFIVPDIVVRGALQTLGDNLGYVLTLVDGRTGAILETLSGVLSGDTLFHDETALGARLGRRLCGYGEVFEVTFTGTGQANFATHSATGTLTAAPITAKPTESDGLGPTHWEGSAPIAWTDLMFTSRTDCSYVNPVSGGVWTAKLAAIGDAMQVQWLADAAGGAATVTAACPNSDGGVENFPGEPATALLDSRPNPFALPDSATQHVSGPGVDAQGYGWENSLDVKVRTVRVEPLG